ncbi:MarR family winged helix-turn-helix transcriptional regulator [Gracilinema caldarium]|uniref:MarR family winged helix-turn-helix transcriptional regulator n=1 Tax=Gracilinema caldarium TaxID=215591 RepID=UPI0026F21094|nr:MarR family transcriptional regulator [Gracilinema caldarium]
MTSQEIDGCLFSFLQTAYHFEAQEKRLFNLSWQEIYLLQLLRYHGPWQISMLGIRMELKKYQTSRLVTRLEELGLVRRSAAGGDRRQIHVELLENGRAKLAEIEAYHRQLFTAGEKRGGPGKDTLAILQKAIHQFAALVGIKLEE